MVNFKEPRGSHRSPRVGPGAWLCPSRWQQESPAAGWAGTGWTRTECWNGVFVLGGSASGGLGRKEIGARSSWSGRKRPSNSTGT